MEDQTVLVEFTTRKAVIVPEDMTMSQLFTHCDKEHRSRFFILVLFSSDLDNEDIVTFQSIRYDPNIGCFTWYDFRTPQFMQMLAHKWALDLLAQKYPPVLEVNRTLPYLVERVA